MAERSTNSKEQPSTLRALFPEELRSLFVERGESKFRGQQAFLRINKHLALSSDEFSEFSLALRQAIADDRLLPQLRQIHSEVARDGTERIAFDSENDAGKNTPFEAVWLVSGKRRTACISSQFGCSLNCSFCATGGLPFDGNLEPWQIIEQLYSLTRLRQERATNVVFMGMGEPLYNYNAVMRSAAIFNHPDGLNIGNRHITISTAGVVPALERWIQDRQPWNLAISLNHVDSTARGELMDIEKRHPLPTLLATLRKYREALDRNITFEYVMIPGYNMGRSESRELIRLVRSLHAKVNLIPLNTRIGSMRPPSDEEVDRFQSELLRGDIPVFNRGHSGREIGGACGMLALQNVKKSSNRQTQ